MAEALLLRCEDPEFLIQQLHDSHDYIVAKSMGSLAQPLVPRHLIESLKVFWPPRHEREAIKEAIKATIRFSKNEAGKIEGELNDLRHKVWSLLRTAYNGDMLALSPFFYAREWEHIRQCFSRVEQQLRSASGVLWRDEVHRPPVTIGYLTRRRRASEERSERIKLQVELGELLLRHHAFVGIAVLHGLCPAECSEFLREWFEGRSAWNGSMGHWHKAGTTVAKRLRSSEADCPDHLRPLVKTLLGIEKAKLSHVAEQIIRVRNEQIGHGFIPVGHAAAQLEEQVDELVCDLLSLLSYLSRTTLLYVNGRRREPSGTWLNVRYLTGDHEVVESGELQVDESAALTVYDGVVHALTEHGWHMLLLDPWLIYRADGNGIIESLWLFDGFDDQAVRYRSPLRPGVTLKASDLRQRLNVLLYG